jgi:hypothetical protein
MRRLVVCALLTIGALAAADVDGKWSGVVNRPDGTRETDVILHVKKDADTVKGTVGTVADDMVPIRNGKLQGDTFTFEVETSNAIYKVNLTAAGDTLKGTVVRTADGQSSPPLAMELKRNAE